LGGSAHNLVRDRDAAYGEVMKRRLRGLGIRDRPITPRSPWQNGHVERLIGSIRRERISPFARMHRSGGRSSAWAASLRNRWSVGYITDTLESDFQQRQRALSPGIQI
jgi:transposase InsO family protein